MTLQERLLAIHRALSQGDISHAFGGAIALAYWTLDPRGTSDIDINVFVPADDCERALAALPSAVAQPDGTEDAIRRDGQVRLFWERTPVERTPVDLFFDYDPVHEAAARDRRTVPFEGTTIPVLGPVELAVFKALFDRTRDWADIEAMIGAGTLDLEAVRETLRSRLGGDDHRLERLAEAERQAMATHRAG